MAGRLWMVSEFYYPEETATGYFLTKIAEGLATHFPVSVLCAQPTYAARGTRAAARERRHDVDIHRCGATSLNKDLLPFRLVNLVTISVALFVNAVRRFRRDDAVLVVTNPPLLPFAIALACRLRGARCLLLIHDVYPEVLTAAGLARADSVLVRIVASLTARLYRAVDRIVVLGRDMKALVIAKVPETIGKIRVIENWADTWEVVPTDRAGNSLLRSLGLSDKFVVQYAGNMGRTHGLEVVMQSAVDLQHSDDVHFLFIGSGAKRPWLESAVREHRLKNVTVLPRQPRSDLAVFLNACDVAIISFLPGMAGVSVPSRTYNILAAARPVIAVADEDSELAMIVREEKVGWVVPPGRSSEVTAAILEARQNRERLAEMGRNGRVVAGTRYTLDRAIDKYADMIRELTLDDR